MQCESDSCPAGVLFSTGGNSGWEYHTVHGLSGGLCWDDWDLVFFEIIYIYIYLPCWSAKILVYERLVYG